MGVSKNLTHKDTYSYLSAMFSIIIQFSVH